MSNRKLRSLLNAADKFREAVDRLEESMGFDFVANARLLIALIVTDAKDASARSRGRARLNARDARAHEG